MKQQDTSTDTLADTLRSMRLGGMADALLRQEADGDNRSFTKRLEDLVDVQRSSTDTRKIALRFGKAKLPVSSASLDQVRYEPGRSLRRETINELAKCRWIDSKQNLLIIGKAGRGKTWLACALSSEAIRQGYDVRYHTLTGLLSQWYAAEAEDRLFVFRRNLAKADLLIIDEWGLQSLGEDDVTRLRHVLDDRHDRGSVLIVSATTVDTWEAWLGEGTVAESIVDRLVNAAHSIELKGESMRVQRPVRQ